MTAEAAAPKLEAALIVEVPQAEDLVGTFRVKYDSSAAVGVPAHITINYPFLPGVASEGPPADRLRALFARFPAADFVLAEVRRWPDVLYLAPEPADRFSRLIDAVGREFPESPPYGGVFTEVTPHLTVADTDDAALLDRVTDEFRLAARGRLPVSARLEQVVLIDNRGGRWHTVMRFPLSAG
jgi:hypothetical protein